MSFIYDPFSDFDRFFDDALSARWPTTFWVSAPRQREGADDRERVIRPRMDVFENKEKNLVKATIELPGLRKDDTNLDFQNGRLIISGEIKVPPDLQEGDWPVRERNYGKFSRTLQLPAGIKPEEIKASMENGVLKVCFPKTSAQQAPKRITVA